MKQHLFKNIRAFIKNKGAVASVEFTLTIGIFFLAFFMILEFGRMAITSAYWDLAVAEGVRETKNSNLHNTGSNYSQALKQRLEQSYAKSHNSVMGLFAVDHPKINVCVDYANSIGGMINNLSKNPCATASTNGINNALARYYITYHYDFLIPLPFLQGFTNAMFTRQFIVVQEHERTDFE